MDDRFWATVTTIAVGIVGIATIAVLVSGNSQTSNVIKSAGSAFSGAISAAVAPVSGGSFTGGGSGLYNQF